MTDLKTALREILPKITLKAKRTTTEKWAIERPFEFHECYSCGEMVDQRIVDICIITSSDAYASALSARLYGWCKIHNDPSVISDSKRAKPCVRCYRWTLTHAKGGRCWMCSHNLHTEAPPPMIRKRPWYMSSPLMDLDPEFEL